MKMKLLIISTLAVVCTLAEPPVDNRYLPPQLGGAGLATSPNLGALSQTYGAPNFGQRRETDAIFRDHQSAQGHSRRPSSQYGAPQRTPSALYGAPSTQYGAPSGQFAAPSGDFGAASLQYTAPSTQYGAPSGKFGAPSTQYGAPSTQNGAPSTQYGAPSRKFGASSRKFTAPLTQYGAPGAQVPSALYGAPGVAGSSQQPGFGATGGQFSHGSGIFKSVDQSRQYLPPGSGRGGYDGEDGNTEPANYSFEYMVKDEPSRNDFGHREARQGDRAEGLYYVLLPDGRKQTVEYEADQDGYKPRISYEDTRASLSGYDRNSQAFHQQGGPY